jgi:uncharacterized membrane protein
MMTEKQYKRWEAAMEFCRKVFHCHQLSERSLFFKGVQLPLCARCTGLVIGFLILGPLISIFSFGNMFVSLALVLIMCADGFIQLKGILESTNIRRVLTGSGAGYGLFSILLHIIIKTADLIF